MVLTFPPSTSDCGLNLYRALPGFLPSLTHFVIFIGQRDEMWRCILRETAKFGKQLSLWMTGICN